MTSEPIVREDVAVEQPTWLWQSVLCLPTFYTGITAFVFAVLTVRANRRGDAEAAAVHSRRALLWVKLSIVFAIGYVAVTGMATVINPDPMGPWAWFEDWPDINFG